jgi:hypothetical protein
MPQSKPTFEIPRELLAPQEDEDAPVSEQYERKSGICFRGMPEEQRGFTDDETPTYPRFPTPRPFLRRIPVLRIALSELEALPLQPRAAFILSNIDGRMTIENILDVCAMPSHEAAQIIDELIDLGVIRLV